MLTTVWARWRCLAYCLMDNHVHLLVETPAANLGLGMQRLHGKYGRDFNDRHGRSGHVFQGRFGSKRMIDDEQLWTTARYIARNPVEAGLCRDALEWEWSSHAGVLAASAPGWLDVSRLLSYFGAAGGDAATRYSELVEGDPENVLRMITVRRRRTGFG
jgi:REP element-mobilizing transposase RayT